METANRRLARFLIVGLLAAFGAGFATLGLLSLAGYWDARLPAYYMLPAAANLAAAWYVWNRRPA